MPKEFSYEWKFSLNSMPEALWPLVADTDKFNRDAGLPTVTQLGKTGGGAPGSRRLGLKKFGISVQWEELPFEWVRPSCFGVERRYVGGPLSKMKVQVNLTPRDTGTDLAYKVNIVARNAAGAAIIPVQIGILAARKFASIIKSYDQVASKGKTPLYEVTEVDLAGGGKHKLEVLRDKLLDTGVESRIAARITSLIEEADDLTVSRIRPFEVADYFDLDRRRVLEACLHATRIGMLDLEWDIVCPHCRGASDVNDSLEGLTSSSYCEGCNLDFSVDFDRSVELTFHPNPSIRKVEAQRFCMGGPEITPHIYMQQLLKPDETRTISLPLESGRYRLRAPGIAGSLWVQATSEGDNRCSVTAGPEGWAERDLSVGQGAVFELKNATELDRLFILERTAWSDQAATAAEVTALQIFRDLFAHEALRPGEQISVGTLAIVFTDLRGSTQLYRQIGDAPAFGRVMTHFDILKRAIAEEDGALVKTIGDAVMAVFRRPVNAVKAMLRAQEDLARDSTYDSPLTLKAGIHIGPCIAVRLNDRLDYFGGTVNMAARLEGLSTGRDIIVSEPILNDPEVRNALADDLESLSAVPFKVRLKGFDADEFDLWRISRAETAVSSQPTRAGAI